MLLYIFHIFFHLTLLKVGIVASIFKVKTDPTQSISLHGYVRNFTARPLLPFLEFKEVSLAITHDLKIFRPILRFRF